ncbi:MAG: ferrous iron transporter B, partial [Firmicutes bacterium HGW-Firmicutes-13]
MTIALAGNPNIGKSTLFNNFTGLNQHVGNWPGKTVELAVGKSIFEGEKIIIVDLPGTYSLTANSPEEIIARDYILSNKADAVIVLVDATNLERNLYFVRQTAELTNKVVVALNMMDIVE